MSVKGSRGFRLGIVALLSAVLSVPLFALAPLPGAHAAGALTSPYHFNFQDQTSAVPAGYVGDYGQAFDAGRGYGWETIGGAPLSLVGNGRARGVSSDARLDTFIHMQAPSGSGVTTPGRWELVVPNGTYNITVAVGDPSYGDSHDVINVEGTKVVDFQPVSTNQISITASVSVNDGRLTVDSVGGTNTKIDYIDVTAASGVTGPVPLIVDTDIFSDADDVGALATAFGLQLKGEAKVIAETVNTRTDRPAVATNSWKCTAAVDQFYNSGTVPIGSATPNNGTATNSPDFIGPCSALATSVPTPDTAVNVLRRALVAQPNSSVVIAEVGYSQNLSALLNSPADSISSLNGHDLVAAKVKTLVAMGGGYPSRPGENNFIGNPAAAQNVANNWPTKIVWSGYEVGAAVHTGNTISATHPAGSPVRVAYEAFVSPGNWIYSWDLTAVYHAVRPSDSLLTEVGPGKNVIDGSGNNAFSMGSGNQYYLSLTNATGLDSAIEALLDTLPAGSTNPSQGPNDTFDTNAIDPSKWTVTPSGSTVAAASQELEITHPAGGVWTKGAIQSVTPYNETGKAVQVQMKRAANNGLGGSPYGETSVFLQMDATHYAYFWAAGSSLTAWVNNGAGEVNLTPSWPGYSSTAMQWLRFRESSGTLYFEYASGTTSPGAWTVFASTPDPFPMTAVTLKIVAGTNAASVDTARFDNISTH